MLPEPRSLGYRSVGRIDHSRLEVVINVTFAGKASSMVTEQKCAVGVTIAAAVVFVSSFLPWGKVHNGLFDVVADDFTFDIAPFIGWSSTITAWNSHIVFVAMPNWLVVIVAGGVIVCCWLRAKHAWRAPPSFMLVLASYGLSHSSVALIMLLTYSNASAKVGAYLTVGAYVGMVAILVFMIRARKPAIMNGAVHR